jgi:hypothetical protein
VPDEKIISLIFCFFPLHGFQGGISSFFLKLPEARAYVPAVIYFLQGLFTCSCTSLLPHEFSVSGPFFAVNAFFDFMIFRASALIFSVISGVDQRQSEREV